MDRLREQTGRHPDEPEQRMELWLAVKATQALRARAAVPTNGAAAH
jgi:purine catabolism regulator